MSTNKAFLVGLVSLLLVTACASNEDLFISHNGNMPAEENIEQVKVGQSQGEVLTLLGSPSNVVSLDKNTWIYMSADIKQVAFFQPEEVKRDILTIKFDSNNQVTEIERIDANKGAEVEIVEEKTETLGHDKGFFEKFFGGTQQYSPFGAGGGGQNF